MSGNPILFSTKSVQVVLSLSKHVYKCTSCGIRCCTVNTMIINLFLYPFTLSIPFPPTRFLKFLRDIPGLHLPSLYSSFPIKVLVGLQVERPIQVHPFQSKFLLVFMMNVQSKFPLNFLSKFQFKPLVKVPLKLPVKVPWQLPVEAVVKLHIPSSISLKLTCSLNPTLLSSIKEWKACDNP